MAKQAKRLKGSYKRIADDFKKREGKKRVALREWEHIFNDLMMDYMLDLQHYSIGINQQMLHIQMDAFTRQAKAMAREKEDQQATESIDWISIANAVYDADMQWEHYMDEKNDIQVKVAAMISTHGLSPTNRMTLTSLLHGQYLPEYDTVYVTCLKTIRIKQVPPKKQEQFDQTLKRFMLDLIVREIKNSNEEALEINASPLKDERRWYERWIDNWRIKRL